MKVRKNVRGWRRGAGNCGRMKKRGWELWAVGGEGMGTVGCRRRGGGNCVRLKKRGWELWEDEDEGVGTVGG